MKSIKVLTQIIVTSMLLIFCLTLQAQKEPFIEGGHYELLDEVQAVQTGDKIEVVELFWYRCPHCYRLEPYMLNWLENIPQNAEFVLLPAIFNERWEFAARAFYTFDALGLVDQLHVKYFHALHGENKDILTLDSLAQWAKENHVDGQAIINTFNSFAVDSKINFSKIMSRKYGVSGVPAIIIDGKYRTNVTLAGSQEQLIEVINFLIEKAAEARKN